jgi:hypothetical protein
MGCWLVDERGEQQPLERILRISPPNMFAPGGGGLRAGCRTADGAPVDGGATAPHPGRVTLPLTGGGGGRVVIQTYESYGTASARLLESCAPFGEGCCS